MGSDTSSWSRTKRALVTGFVMLGLLLGAMNPSAMSVDASPHARMAQKRAAAIENVCEFPDPAGNCCNVALRVNDHCPTAESLERRAEDDFSDPEGGGINMRCPGKKMYWNGRACVSCQGRDEKCKCRTTKWWSSDDCIECPIGMKNVNGNCASRCNPGSRWDGEKCTCPDGQGYFGTHL
jgi:hypothetical protein